MGLMPRKYYLGDDFFDAFFEPALKDQMKCDIYEKDNKFFIEMDIPGYRKEDIKVECENGYIHINGEVKHEENEEDKDKKYIRRERNYSKFNRSFYVGDVDESAISASFENGTLKLVAPKVEPEQTRKTIEIK